MLRRNLTKSGFFNRKDLKSQATSLAQNKRLTVLLGPPSSGKTALVAEATKNIHKIRLDLRGYGINDKEALVSAFKDSFVDIAQPSHAWAPLLGNLGTIVGISAAKEQSKSLIEILFGDPLSPGDVVSLFDKTLAVLTKEKREVFVLIDEFSRLFSKGDPDKKWRDDFADDLEQVLIKHTKQAPEKYVTAIITSSDQQYYDHFTELEEKKFAKTKYLGYMPPDHVMEYLEKELSVEDVETRKKIADYAGGHFTVLQDLATSLNPDAEIQQSKMEDLDLLEMKIADLSPEAKKSFKEQVIPKFLKSGFVPSREVSRPALKELVSHNMVSLRGQTTDTVWSPDLPDAARKVPVVLTPFVPTQRHVLGDVQVK